MTVCFPWVKLLGGVILAPLVSEVFGDTAVGQMVIDWATHSLITYVITFHIKVIYTIQKLVNFTPAGSPPKMFPVVYKHCLLYWSAPMH